jgi:hypothetical protein
MRFNKRLLGCVIFDSCNLMICPETVHLGFVENYALGCGQVYCSARLSGSLVSERQQMWVELLIRCLVISSKVCKLAGQGFGCCRLWTWWVLSVTFIGCFRGICGSLMIRLQVLTFRLALCFDRWWCRI